MGEKILIRTEKNFGCSKYYKKQFSILGDSISTLDGYNPRGYKLFYTGETCKKANINTMQDTWWGKLIDILGGELLVNNSWSGSRVTKLPSINSLFPSGCSDERTGGLHIDSVLPDVIIVYLGTNDWAFGVKCDGAVTKSVDMNHGTFRCAYNLMLEKLRKNYPNSEIWCCTLSETKISQNPNFKFPYAYEGTHIEEFNNVIREAVRKQNCRLIDLYQYHEPYDSMDGTHPTVAGMMTLADLMLRTMGGKELSDIMGYENNSEYVMLDPNKTHLLYKNILKLTSEKTGKVIEIQKSQIQVGRDPSCDIRFDSPNQKRISRIHATFYYEKEAWFLCDKQSTNGTYLNGTRIESGKKYELAADDVIQFADVDKLVFYKTNVQKMAVGNEEEKALAFLSAAMSVFKKSGEKDSMALQMIISALVNAPLYFPVEIDIAAMFGNLDPAKLKEGDTVSPQKDVKMKILTLKLDDGTELVPMFTSKEEVEKKQKVSVIRYYPQDYFPMLVKMNKMVVINPFSENRFLLYPEMIKNIIMPILLGNKDNADSQKQIMIDSKYELLECVRKIGCYKRHRVRDRKSNNIYLLEYYDKKYEKDSSIIINSAIRNVHMREKLDHPMIPKIVDLYNDEKCFYYVAEYENGIDLEHLLKGRGKIDASTVIEWTKQLCQVLQYLHTLNPPHIHRDIKPANIILLNDNKFRLNNNKLRLIDFDIMMLYDPKGNSDEACVGSRGYAPPEQYKGPQYCDIRTDIYALGMTMYTLLTGINPADPGFVYRPIRQINPALPEKLERIIERCIMPKQEDRYPNCEEIIRDLNNDSEETKQKGFWKNIFGSKK